MITDIQMPGASGLDLLRAVKETSPETVVIMITAFATTETAIEAMKEGAYDYLTKPFKVDEIRLVVEKALEKKLLTVENQRLRTELRTQARQRVLIGTSAAMQRVYELMAQVAATRDQRAHLRRERHRQGAGRARDPRSVGAAREGRSSRSTAARSRRTCSSPSCSGT